MAGPTTESTGADPAPPPPPRAPLVRQTTATATPLPVKVYGKKKEKDIRETAVVPQHSSMASVVAGLGSGALASIVCAPLDLLRTRLQVMGSIHAHPKGINEAKPTGIFRALAAVHETEGIRGCFRGLGATLLTVPAFWGLYFPLYEASKRELLHKFSPGVESPENVWAYHMMSAIVSGAVADVVCNPMFVIRTRMQTEALHIMETQQQQQQPQVTRSATGTGSINTTSSSINLLAKKQDGIWQTTRNIYAEGGLPVFWRGLTASLFGLTHVAIQFPVYEFLKQEARLRSRTHKETPLDLLLASAISKMTASTLTYPHEVVRSRLMDSRVPAGQNLNAWRMACLIVREEGFSKLYRGLHVSLVRVVPNCCITFLSYELLLRWSQKYSYNNRIL